jgi:hypothetical protein
MKIRHHDHQYLEAELTPQDARWRVRAIGLGIMLALLAIYWGYRLFVQRAEILPVFGEPGSLILIVLTGLVLSSSFTYETETLRLDRVQNQFRIVQRNIMGERVLQGNLRQVQDMRVTRSVSDDHGDQYQVALQISGQPSIRLTGNQRLSGTQLAQFEPVREFLGLPPQPPVIE